MTGLYCWAASHVGRVRRSNEDAFLTSGMGETQTGESWQGALGSAGWALVADGMGGHAAGEIASKLALECLRAVLRPDMDVAELTVAIEETNRALFRAMVMRPELSGMGTTIAGVLINGTRAMLFNAGDSRIYIANDQRLEQLSEDHVLHGHQLTKCLGGMSSASPVVPHISVIDVGAASRLLLCTDGLTNEIKDPSLLRLIQGDEPARNLVDAAVQGGGRDNVTAIVLRLGPHRLEREG